METFEPRVLLSADLAINLTPDLHLDHKLPGEHLTVKIDVKNSGDTASSAPFRVEMVASLDDTLSDDDVVIGSKNFSNKLSPAQQKTLTLPVDLPKTLDTGNYTLIARVDTENKIPESNETNNTSNLGSLNVEWAFGAVEGHKGSSVLTVKAEDGAEATFKLTGGGRGSVSYENGQFNIDLTGTTSRSDLTVKITANSGPSSIGDINSGAGLRSIKLSNAALAGDININGSLTKLSLGNVSDSHIRISGVTGKLDVTASNIQNLNFESTLAIGKFTANQWLDTDAEADLLKAPALASLSINGDFQADLHLTSTDAGGFALRTANINGASTGAWNIQGKASTLNLGSTTDTWNAAFTGGISILKSDGDLSGNLSTPSILTLHVGRNLSEAEINVGANLGADGILGGVGANADSFITDKLKPLKQLRVIGNINDSTFRIGVNPNDDAYDGNDVFFGVNNPIQKIVIAGELTGASKLIALAFPLNVSIKGKNTLSKDVSEFLTSIPPSEVPIVLGLQAALLNVTGSASQAGLTKDATISGQIITNQQILSTFKVGFDATALAQYSDFTASVGSDGKFTLTPQQLGALFPSQKIPEGAHTLHLIATDQSGASKQSDVAFILDTTLSGSFGVSAADAVSGDTGKSNAARVTLQGITEARAMVKLGDQTAIADSNGTFILSNVALTLGNNNIVLNISDAAGNTSNVSRTIVRIEQQQVQSDVVLDWNNIALQAIQNDVTDPPLASRTLAILSLAQYDTLAAIQGTPAYLVQRSLTGSADTNAALATAAHRILSLTYPAQKSAFGSLLAADLAEITDGAAKDTGIALGLSIADAIWGLRSNDGFDGFSDYSGSTTVGQWRPTGPAFDVPDEPHWGEVTPFALTAANQYRPATPAALDTAAYAAAVNEVKLLGSATSSTRTADQTQQALF